MADERHCVSCGARLAGPWCAACGERAPGEQTRTLGDFLGDAIEVITNVNGKLLLSLRLLAFRPGFLSTEYVRGARVRYMRPVQLFLLANVLFFLLTMFPTFSTPLQVHLWAKNFPHQSLALEWVKAEVAPDMEREDFQAVVDHWLAGTRVEGEQAASVLESLRELAGRFNPRVDLQGRTLIILMIPLYALWLAALNFRRRPHAIEHLVFATHFMAFLLLFILLQMWTIYGTHRLVSALSGWDGIRWLLNEGPATVVSGIVLATWLALGVRRFYGRGPWPALVQGVLLAIALNLTLQVYRSILFFTVWWSL